MTRGRLPRVPLRGAAALFLERQHLDRPRARRLGPASLARFAEDVGGIQLDTINVVERAHHLTLWSRFGPYSRATFDRLAYERRVLFEYWAHAACLVPIGHYRMWRYAMGGLRWSYRPASWRSWVKKNRTLVRAVEGALRERGPLASADFEHRPPGPRGGWWDRKPATHALDYLWMTGVTAVHSRVNFQKRYDLMERVFPGAGNGPAPSAAAFERWRLARSLRAMGAATELDLRRYLTFPGKGVARRRQALRRALIEGEVVEVAVEPGGAGPARRWVALAEDLPALARAAERNTPSRGTALLSPFDSLLWHRERVSRLFGFDYKIEVYVPAPKRRHGYYSLPILHDGHLIGRLDPKTWREDRHLEVRAAHFEPWFAKGSVPPAASWGSVDRDQALAGVAEALTSLAAFTGADHVTLGRVVPSALGAPLRRALRRSSPSADAAAPASARRGR